MTTLVALDVEARTVAKNVLVDPTCLGSSRARAAGSGAGQGDGR